MKSNKQQKADHLLRMNVTQEDERLYREPEPLTREQKEEMLYEVERIKKVMAGQEEAAREYLKRNYEGTQIRDHYNH